MARKTKTVTITDEGRDKGKKFFIKEMSTNQAEDWAARAISALLSSGVDIPDNIQNAGMATIATVGLTALGKIHFDLLKPLMDEMFTCIQFDMSCIGGTGTRDIQEGDGINIEDGGDIEEIKTRLTLRKEVLELHLGFSIASKASTMGSAAANQVEGNSTT